MQKIIHKCNELNLFFTFGNMIFIESKKVRIFAFLQTAQHEKKEKRDD